MKIRQKTALAALLAGCLTAPVLAEPANGNPAPDFFAAALCQPPYSTDTATGLYEAAEKIAEADTSSLGAAIYALPEPVVRDGFTAKAVVFAEMSVGVLIEGEVADALARQYDLARESSHLLGASKNGFSRRLPNDQQQMKELGLISIVAREGPAMPGKTLLTCEFVSHEDRQALSAMEARQER